MIAMLDASIEMSARLQAMPVILAFISIWPTHSGKAEIGDSTRSTGLIGLDISQ